MSQVSGKVCAITGAGSGIGRQVALELARRGARLAIADFKQEGLDETARLLDGVATEVHTTLLDVRERETVEAWAQAVAAHFGVVHQIYNNAGVASGHTILESGYPELESVIQVNLWGVIYGTKAFLPHLIASGDGHVINTSSLNGYFAQTKLSAYVTTKFGVRGFTEVLREEMLAAGHPVQVSVVHPGGVKTNIASGALDSAAEVGVSVTDADRKRAKMYEDKLLKLPADEAARIIVSGVEKNRFRILVGSDAKAVDVLVRLMPTAYQRISLLVDKLNSRGS